MKERESQPFFIDNLYFLYFIRLTGCSLGVDSRDMLSRYLEDIIRTGSYIGPEEIIEPGRCYASKDSNRGKFEKD
jgi:hypothetical protein